MILNIINKRFQGALLIIFILVVSLTTCKPLIDPIIPRLVVNPTTKICGEYQGSFTFEITTNISWTVSANVDWIELTPTKDQGDGTVKVDYSKNITTTSRNATITVKGTDLPDKTVEIIQNGVSPILNIVPNNQKVGTPKGNTSFSVTSNTNWTAISDQIWCTLSQNSGSGNAEIKVNYEENTLSSARIAKITFSIQGATDVIVTVSQVAFIPSILVTPSNQTVAASASNYSFIVASNIPWTAESNQDWCVINTSGIGDGFIVANYTDNTTLSSRNATIIVKGAGVSQQALSLTQTALVPSLTIIPTNQEVTNNAGMITFTITSNTNWVASIDQNWCTIDKISGTGNATITVTYQENITSLKRFAVLSVTSTTLASKTATLTQQSIISTNKLIAYYPFNGNANDESGNGNNGTVLGATLTTDRKGNTNSAYNFNGQSSYIKVLNSNTLQIGNTISIAAWIKVPTITNSYSAIIDKFDDGTNCGYNLNISEINTISIDIGNCNTSITTKGISNMEYSQWTFVVGIFNGSSVKVYVNGNLENTFSTAIVLNSNTMPLYIGVGSEATNRYFNGLIDDIRIYNKELIDIEIHQLFIE